VLVVVGPTGSGKSDLAVRLAHHYGSPVISADSRQVFRGMAIGTAQPDAAQLAAIPHHFIADRDITKSYTCGTFEQEALALLGRLFAAGHDVVIVAGGSGLYIDALCYGMDPLPQDSSMRAELNRRLREEGLVPLVEELHALDPDYCATVDRSNPQRVVRALEVCLLTGLPYSAARSGRRTERDFRIVKLGIEWPRTELYDRIDRRTDAMVASGFEAEARALHPHRALNALRTLGYREWFDCFDGITTREEAIEQIKRNTRRYAKRQLTWFRRDPTIRWVDPNVLADPATLIAELDLLLR